jgi:hypothetical protein
MTAEVPSRLGFHEHRRRKARSVGARATGSVPRPVSAAMRFDGGRVQERPGRLVHPVDRQRHRAWPASFGRPHASERLLTCPRARDISDGWAVPMMVLTGAVASPGPSRAQRIQPRLGRGHGSKSTARLIACSWSPRAGPVARESRCPRGGGGDQGGGDPLVRRAPGAAIPRLRRRELLQSGSPWFRA